MSQIDWVGGAPPTGGAFRDIRSTRPSVAEEKAVLLYDLGQLLNRVPASVRNGSVQLVRQWKAARDSAQKVAGNSRSSVHEISAAVNRLRQFLGGEQ